MAITGKVVTLKDRQDLNIFPETSASAVYLDNGKTIEEGINSYDKTLESITINNSNMIKKIDDIENSTIEVSSQLVEMEQQKANNNEVRKKNVLLTMADVGQDIKIALTGGSVAVVGENAITRVNIVDKQVTESKLTILKDENNIWNFGDTITFNNEFTGSWKSKEYEITDGISEGDILTLYVDECAGSLTTDYVELSTYLKNGVPSSVIGLSSETKSKSITLEKDIGKIIIKFIATREEIMQSGSVVKWFGVRLVRNGTLDYKLSNNVKIDFENINNVKIKKDYTDFFTGNLNMINKATCKMGIEIDYDSGLEKENASYFTTDFIELENDESLKCNKYGAIFFYNKDKLYLGRHDVEDNVKITIIPTTKYTRLSVIGLHNMDSVMLTNFSNERIGYSKYNTNFIKNEYIDKQKLNGWYGKKWTSFGHSIVAMEAWQKQVATELGLIHTNCGIGGSTVSGTDGTTGSKPMWTDERIDVIPADSELITILAGGNDQKGTDNMGEWGSRDTETFYGAYTIMLEKLYARCPNAKIILMRDTRRKIENWGIWKADDYRDTVSKIGKEFGYPVIDMDKLCGINYLNWDKYLEDDVHPNYLGGDLMAEVVVGFLKSIAPLSKNQL